jgi:hypothetical protein
VESGAACAFTAYAAGATLESYDTGFRCCYDADPTQSPGHDERFANGLEQTQIAANDAIPRHRNEATRPAW